MEEKKGFIGEFKEFIARGNVMDMAVGVVIGSAFSAIVTSLVNDIIGPIIGVITGGVDFSKWGTQVGEATILWGAFIQAIINFLIVALVIFSVVKAFNKMKKKEEAPAEEPAPEEPPAPAEDIVLLTEIRDLLKK
ncbi:MAG: large-conductance mechanosensitive channel protein MscL [Mogibacterium sp.]|nr:large-conductance mechanosensitive channel protein MscL [Mogibacterium sp.]